MSPDNTVVNVISDLHKRFEPMGIENISVSFFTPLYGMETISKRFHIVQIEVVSTAQVAVRYTIDVDLYNRCGATSDHKVVLRQTISRGEMPPIGITAIADETMSVRELLDYIENKIEQIPCGSQYTSARVAWLEIVELLRPVVNSGLPFATRIGS